LVNFFPSALVFGYQNTGTTSVAQNVTLTNVGNASLSISGIAMGGTNAGDFAQTNTCSSSLAAGTNCTISVTFTPSAGGSRSASLNVTDNASGSPQAVGLTGTGVQPLVILSPGSLAFGAQGVDVASAPQNVTLTNTGSSPVSISSIYTSDGDFSQSNNCPTNVKAGATCTISITFAPYSTGAVNALLYVADNSIGSPQSASLAGKGITAPGTYQLSVEAASTNGSNISHSVAVTVVVQ
jgi:hypothetical protein